MPEASLLALSFAAGLVSFLSPCVLPLVPGYLSYMSGFAQGEQTRRRALKTGTVAVVFMLGFTVVFVLFGASATAAGSFLRSNRELLTRVGGALIIVFGLVFMGAIRVPFLYREARFHPTPRAGLWGSFILGAAFAFGWSPCIGATMGLALTFAATRETLAEGMLLLGIYSLGLGVPFVLAGIGVSRLTGALAWLRRHTRTINMASGALLVVVGVLFLTDQLFRISIWMQQRLANANLDFWNF